MFAPLEAGLDAAQLAMADHGDEPLLVTAGAGTGKTRALVCRVARLLERGVPPERLLLLTFTRRAAEEMLARAAALAGPGTRRPQGGTFHAVAYRYVAAHAGALGLPDGFGVLSPSEAGDLMDLMRGDYGLSGTAARLPRPATMVEAYSRCVNTRRPLREVLAVDYPWCEPHFAALAELFAAYTERKAQSALLDFDDLLLYWSALLSDERLRGVGSQFDYVLVDEYQDVNSLQVDIVRLLAPTGRGPTVVGDEAQAVYSFRGGGSRHVRELVLSFPDACVRRLERNFRSRQRILDLANVLRPASGGPDVVLFSDRGPGPKPLLVRCHDDSSEARAVVERVLAAHEDGTALRDQAVLVRAAHHSDLVEVELAARRVPYRKYGGLRFLEAAHVKDFVVAARLVGSPHDELAWFRLLRLHDGIGPASARAMAPAGTPAADRVQDWPDMVALAPPRARAALSRTLRGLAEARSLGGSRLQAEAVLEAIRPLVSDRYPDAAARLGDLERLAAAADRAPDLAAWVAELTLAPPESTGDLAGPPRLDEDFLVVSTIHSAKGLEWPVVHIPHVVDGFIPIDMALGREDGLEEEQRLFYVAVTRARDELYLYAPLRVHYHRHSLDDRHGLVPESRFLGTRTSRLVDVADYVSPPLTVPAPAGVPVAAVAGKISAQLAQLWAP